MAGDGHKGGEGLAFGLASDVVSLDLVGSSVPDPIQIDEESVDALAHELDRHRVLGVAVRRLEDGRLVGPESLHKVIIDRHDTVMTQTLRTELMAVRASSMLADAGIEHRLLKGAGLAHTIAPSAMERSFRDVDVLIRSDEIEATIALFLKAGATRLQPELRPGFDRRFSKSVTLRLDDVEIDLHRLLASGPFGVWMNPLDLFVLKRDIELAGRSVPTLDPTDHLLHACYHVALGQLNPVLSNLRDIALLAHGPIDELRFQEVAARWQGVAVIQRAVTLVESGIDVDLPDWLAQYRHSDVEQVALDALEPYLSDSPGGRFADLAPATLKALPMGDRPAFALAVGFPSGSDPVDRVRSMIKKLPSD